MKDIDFDELDRAVSSALEPVTNKTPAADEPAVPAASEPVEAEAVTPEAESVPEPEPAPVATTPAPAPAADTEAATPAPAAKTPLAIKRRGQFMDVVHPSSDMTTKPEEVATMPARKVTLKPLTPAVAPDATESEATAPADADVTAAPAAPEAPATEAAAEPQPPVETVEPAPTDHVMPDPLDVMQTQEKTKDVAEVSTIEDTPVEPSEETEIAPSDEEAAPATPFLTDTKVDKRPLDAFSADEVPTEPMAEPVAAAEPLPPELQADVIAVESNPSERADDVEAEPAAEDKKDATEPSESGFNASIPQQYASTEGKADDDHSIFDTHEYHQPLTPAKTKKRGLPGWLVAVIVIFLLAGLGAAGGYFWFQYGL